MRTFIIALTTLFIITPVLAHDWYPPQCCNGDLENGDCHAVPCDQLTEQDKGEYSWKNYTFSRERVFSSQDAKCHVCVGNGKPGGGQDGYPYCVFIQQGT